MWNKSEFLNIWLTPEAHERQNTRVVFWVDDAFFGTSNENLARLSYDAILRCADEVRTVTSEASIKWSDECLLNESASLEHRVKLLGFKCREAGLSLKVGHFQAIDEMDLHVLGLSSQHLFLVDIHNSEGAKANRGKSTYGIDLVAERLRDHKEQVRFYSRITTLEDVSRAAQQKLGISSSVFNRFYAYSPVQGNVDSIFSAIQAHFNDPCTWFLLPPSMQQCNFWFKHGIAHAKSQPLFDSHIEAVCLKFPTSIPWSWRNESNADSAKALFGLGSETAGKSASPYALQAVFVTKLEISSDYEFRNITLPTQPAFPFIWAMRLAFKAIDEEHNMHGALPSFERPSGKIRLSFEEPSTHFLAMEYEGAESIARGVATNPHKGAVATAVAKAVYGVVDPPNLHYGSTILRENLSKMKGPLAQPEARSGWFGFRWPISPQEKNTLSQQYKNIMQGRMVNS